jgi:hypothetical protein
VSLAPDPFAWSLAGSLTGAPAAHDDRPYGLARIVIAS